MPTNRPATMAHVSLGTNDFARAKAFYDAVLATLGLDCVLEFCESAGWGREMPEFWIERPCDGGFATAGNGTHVCFQAQSVSQVRAFHAQALAMGGRDEGAPGFRPQYTPQYYAAFVRDLDGHKIEAMCWAEPHEG